MLHAKRCELADVQYLLVREGLLVGQTIMDTVVGGGGGGGIEKCMGCPEWNDC